MTSCPEYGGQNYTRNVGGTAAATAVITRILTH
jgi:hypothetical protein